MTTLPNVGERCHIRIGLKVINGVCVKNVCRRTVGPDKGQIVPDVGVMRAEDGNEYWLSNSTNWSLGHA